MTLYVYDIETRRVIGTVTGDTNKECEAKAEEEFPFDDNTGWTYSPAFGANDGLVA